MNMPIKGKRPRAMSQVIFPVVIVALFSSGSCSLLRGLGPAPPALREDFSVLRPEDFAGKIKQLEEISQNDKSLAVRTRALYYIALAHAHYKNPSPDYPKAVQYLDKYIGLETDRQEIDDIVAWKAVVQALDNSLRDAEKLEKSYVQLKQQSDSANKNKELLAKKITDLGQVIENQKKEIERLKKTITELDTVQQEIEKKRKGIKK
jgi:hypothetical protein